MELALIVLHVDRYSVTTQDNGRLVDGRTDREGSETQRRGNRGEGKQGGRVLRREKAKEGGTGGMIDR